LVLALLLAASAAVLGALALAASRPWQGGLTPPAALLPDLNAAPERHLVLLPGIGPARARAIVEERANGPFGTVDDLSRVRGIGPMTAAALAPLVRVPDPAAARVREGDP
jgi:competence protein ComEA